MRGGRNELRMRGVLVVGSGLLGRAFLQQLTKLGWPADTVARSAAGAPRYRVDLADAAGRDTLARVIADGRYGRVLLCHGPSDITWCEENPQSAAEVHVGVAKRVADLGTPVLLVSTDNVFPGARADYRTSDATGPTNHYGRVKLAAEQAVLAGGGQVVRVSLVYGWSRGHRPTYAQQCLSALAAGERITAAEDQVCTPVHVDDVASAVVALAIDGDRESAVTHLAGPQALSRYAFARLCTAAIGTSPERVVAVPRADTPLACRPPYSGLTTGPFRAAGCLGGFRPIPPAEGLHRMVRTWPR